MTSKESMKEITRLCESYHDIKKRDAYDAVGYMRAVISVADAWRKDQEKEVK